MIKTKVIQVPDDESYFEFAICEECLVMKIFPLFIIPVEQKVY